MKYRGEKIKCNNLIEYNFDDTFKPYINKCEEFIKNNDFENILIQIKKGMPLKVIIQSYERLDKEIKEQSCFQWICTSQQIGADGRIINYNRGENLGFFDTFSQINYFILNFMIKYKKISIENVKDILNNSYILNHKDFISKEYTTEILIHGFKKSFVGDAISAIHILMPQIEYILRSLCKINNIKHIKEQHNCESFYQLGFLIQSIKESNLYFPKYFINYLEMYLLNINNEGGLNYRNDVSHGVPTKLDTGLLGTIIIMLLYLIN